VHSDLISPPALEGMTLARLMAKRVADAPNRVALAGMSATGVETRITYAQLDWGARKFASILAARGVQPGDRVGIMLGNDAVIEFGQGIMGVHQLGGTFVPVNARFALEEVVYVVNKGGLRALVVSDRLAEAVASARGRMPTLETLITVGGGRVAGCLSWDDLVAQTPVDRSIESQLEPSDRAEILFTSGTTANPKGAVHTHSSAVHSSCSMAGAFALTPEDVLQTFMPLFTSGGVRALTCALWAGCTIVFDPALDVDAVIERMARERTTRYVGTSAFYIFLLDKAGERSLDVSNLKAFMFGGSPTSAEVVRRLDEGFPGIELRNMFAPTETGPAGTLIATPEILERPTSVGRPWAFVEMKVVDDDDNTLPAGERGEICTRGPCIMSGYYGDPELSAEALKGGWHHTGDIGVIDEDGYLSIVDRKKDMVIRGGHNIASLEVEQVLSKHPAVAEAAVVGVPHPKLGEDVQAFLLLRSGQKATPEEVRAFCAGKLADYKIPRKVCIVDALPRGPLGKVLKSALRETAVEMNAQAAA
jgi:acyl-CoA synthetase (AMP-forming)/AMP-acid ligase II